MIRRFARPWARAILDAAGSPQKANDVRAELQSFADALRGSTDLRELFSNPAIETEQKLAVTAKVAARLHAGELALKTLEVLVRFHRINDIDAVLAALAAYVNTELGIAVAEVRSAGALTAEERESLMATLSRKVGKRVELDVRTDTTLLGGFVVKIGSEIWDASVAGKINKFSESLT